MSRMKKSPDDIRREAAAMVRTWAREQERLGDAEGAGMLRDLALEISRIRLTKDRP